MATPRFDRIGCHVRALHRGEERCVAQGVNFLLPLPLCLIRWVDVLDVVAFAVSDDIRDPSALHLDGSRTIGEQSRTLRSIEMEHVGISGDGGAQVGVGRFFPLVVERFPVDVAKTHSGHAAGDDVETRGNANDVEVVVRAVLQVDARFVETDDSIVLDVNDIDVGSIELLKVSILETRSFDAPIVGFLERCKYVLLFWVVEARSLLFSPERICLLVGLRVKQVVFVVAQPIAEASILPKLFVKLFSLFWSVVEGVSFREGIKEASEAMFTEVEELRIPLLGYLLLLDCEVSLAHWDGQVGSPLEDLEVTGLGAPSLRYLDTSRSSSDNGTLLALDWDLFVGPERGMMYGSFEFVDTGPIRDVSLGRKASADDQIFGFGSTAICCLHVPASFVGLELSVSNNTFESCLTFDIEDFITSIKVIS